ncbi:hypothetical protein BDN67DRAFT_435752 [Paxillus ammoniavirescens]|nr:hypothetical protein BDN67DRAFT_435752 [Paxillus ammoniavirescens]
MLALLGIHANILFHGELCPWQTAIVRGWYQNGLPRAMDQTPLTGSECPVSESPMTAPAKSTAAIDTGAVHKLATQCRRRHRHILGIHRDIALFNAHGTSQLHLRPHFLHPCVHSCRPRRPQWSTHPHWQASKDTPTLGDRRCLYGMTVCSKGRHLALQTLVMAGYCGMRLPHCPGEVTYTKLETEKGERHS